MPPRDPDLRLQDIADAIDRIFEYTAQHSLESFARNRMAIDAVVRNLEVIGEAARHVDAATVARLATIPWQDMRDFATCGPLSDLTCDERAISTGATACDYAATAGVSRSQAGLDARERSLRIASPTPRL